MINRSLNKSEQALLFLTILTGIFALLYFFCITPWLEKINSLQKQIETRENVLLKHRRFIEMEKNIQDIYQTSIKTAEIEVSREEEIAKFLREIENLSRKSKIRIVDIKPRESKIYDKFNKSIVDIEFEAQQASLAEFLYKLAQSPLGIRIEQLKITARQESKAPLLCHTIISRVLVDQ